MKSASNVFVLRSRDPGILAVCAASLAKRPEWTHVEQVGRTCLCAAAPLPGGLPPVVDPRARTRSGPSSGGDLDQPSFTAVAHATGAAGYPGGSTEPSLRILFSEGREIAEGVPDGSLSISRLALDHPERLSLVPGDFCFVVVESTGRLAAVRSCAGTVPLYVYEKDGLLAVASRTADLLRHVPGPHKPDELVWASYSSGCTIVPDNRGFVASSTALPRGHASLCVPSRPSRLVRYFDPTPPRWPEASAARRTEHADRLRELLFSTLESQLDPAGVNLLALSGGVDSSSLGALAAGKLGLAVSTVSMLSPRGEPGEVRERRYVESLHEAVGFRRQVIFNLEFPESLELLRKVPDVGFPVPSSILASLPGVSADEPVSVLFGGEGADEVCGDLVTLPDWSSATSLSGMVRSLRDPAQSRLKDPLRWASWRLLWSLRRPRTYATGRLGDVFAPSIREEYRDVIGRHRAHFARQPEPWRFLSMWRAQDAWVASGWEVASELGIRRSYPFLTREMTELVYDCHPCELVVPGRKKLLKAALDGLVPGSHLYRSDPNVNTLPVPPGDLSWGRPLPDVVTPFVSSRFQDAPGRAPALDCFTLTLLDVAGRSFENLALP